MPSFDWQCDPRIETCDEGEWHYSTIFTSNFQGQYGEPIVVEYIGELEDGEEEEEKEEEETEEKKIDEVDEIDEAEEGQWLTQHIMKFSLQEVYTQWTTEKR